MLVACINGFALTPLATFEIVDLLAVLRQRGMKAISEHRLGISAPCMVCMYVYLYVNMYVYIY